MAAHRILLLLCALFLTQDNAVQGVNFLKSMYSMEIPETGVDQDGMVYLRPSPGFLSVECTDSQAPESSISYSILTSASSFPGPIIVNASTGDLATTDDFDYETRTSYTFTAMCNSSSSLAMPMQATTIVEVTIQPVNEFAPFVMLRGGLIHPIVIIREDEVSMGDILISPVMGMGEVQLTAYDNDAGEDGVLSFSLSGLNRPFFSVNGTTGVVIFSQQPDADIPGSTDFFQIIAFALEACDASNVCYTSNSILMYLIAVDDNLPMFAMHEFTDTILEDSVNTVGMVIANASCTDGDIGPGKLDRIEFVQPSAQVIQHFIIPDPKRGIVFLNHTLDYEQIKSIGFMLICLDTAGNNDTATVTVNVEPRNDNMPSFDQVSYNFTVSRTAPTQYLIGRIRAIDRDEDVGGNLTYTISANAYFSIDQFGDIRLLHSIQNASAHFSVLTVTVSDGTFQESTVTSLTFSDGNFERPVFVTTPTVRTVSELTPVGKQIYTLKCNDSETGLNGLISYSIVAGNTGNAFRIDSSTGSVSVASPLILGENQTTAQYFITYRCSDHGVPVFSDLTSGLIVVYKDDISPPNIGNDTIVAFINEDARFGDVVVTVVATDNDTREFEFELHNLTVPEAFLVEINTGRVIVGTTLDREAVSSYSMVITATEVFAQGTIGPEKSDSANLIIYVRDINDNAPVCGIFATFVDIEPDLDVGSVIIDLNCTDADTSNNANISYVLVDDFDVLQVNSNGVILLSNSLLLTNRTALNVRVLVADMGVPVISTEANILIRIRSRNNHIPTFTNLPDSLEVSESAALFSLVFTVTAEDPDKGEFGIVRFRLEDESTLPFTLTPNTGELFVASKLNFFTQNQYTLNISAFDPDFTVHSTLNISILDANEYTPQCNQLLITQQILENLDPTLINTIPLSCSDQDLGSFGQLSYEIISGNTDDIFSVTSSGVVSATTALDYEQTQQYMLIVQVSDGGSPPLSQNVTISVVVVPVNEFTPVISNISSNLSVVEGTNIGTIILQVMATDEDSGNDGELDFSLVPTQSIFGITDQGAIQITGTVDREKQEQHNFVVRVADRGQPPRLRNAAVVVRVTDVDDSPPNFNQALYIASLNANQVQIGATVVTVECTDLDEGENANVVYQLAQSKDSVFFAISASGEITINQTLPLSGIYSFPVHCRGEKNPNFNDTAQVSVTIQVNSNITFSTPNGTYIEMLSESSVPIHTFLTINATSITGTTLTYNLVGSPSIFSIGDTSGALSLVGQLDYESTKSYTLVVEASDSGSPPNTGQAVVFILVLNANDEVPRFTTEANERTLVEGQMYTTVGQYQCTDGDEGVFGVVTYSIGSGNTDNAFFVDSVSGNIQLTTGMVDYESAQSFSLQLVCSDGGSPAHMDSIIIPIFVTPVNEHPPLFSTSSISVGVSESLISPNVIATNILATDQDDFPHNQIWYTIREGNELQKFDISHSTGHITLIQPLDYESVREFTLTIQADDSGGISQPNFIVLNSTVQVVIQVTDANDHTPVFNRSTYVGTIDECASVGDLIEGTQVVCSDGDSGSNADTTLSITDGNTANAFSISTNGRIRVDNTLDFESTSSYILTIRCSDQGTPVRANEVTAIINIRDCGEFGPVFNQTNYQFSVPEGNLPGSEVGEVVAIDQDGGDAGKVTYSFNNDTNIPFGIDPDTGVITVTQPLDYETQAKSYFIVVNATDSANQTDSVVIVINLINADDNVPTYSQSNYYGTIRENSSPGTTVSLSTPISCTDADDAADGIPVTYAIQDTENGFPLIVQSSSGVLSALGELDTETRSRYIFSVSCRDSGGNTALATLTVDILPFNDFPPRFLNTPYSVTTAENPLIGSTIFTVEAADDDVLAYNTFTYGIEDGNGASLFSIEPSSGQITVQQVVDYEQFSQITLNISATNIIPAGDTSGSPKLAGFAELVINVTDLNDNNPVLSPLGLIVVITDENLPGTVVTQFTCTDADEGLNGETSIFLNGSNAGKFQIYPNGTLVTTQLILSDLILGVSCTDMGDPPNTAVTVVSVQSQSMNDFTPMFDVPFGTFDVLENHTVGEDIGCIIATDRDGTQTPDGIISYSLQLVNSSVTSDRFDVNENTGCIFVSLALDYDEENRYDYHLIATDRGVPSRHTAIQVIINIVNVLKDPPEFVGGPYMRNMSEGIEVGTVVTAEPRCTDRDDEDLISYSIVAGNGNNRFTINSTTGIMVLSNSLDYEASTQHSLTIRCTDSSGLFDEENVYVTVFPVNEFTPLLTSEVLSFVEQAVVGTQVAMLKFSDGDAGPDGVVSFVITSNTTDGLFTITPQGTLLVSAILDREEVQLYNLTIQLTDGSPEPMNRRMSSNWVAVNLTDINDNAPQPQFNSDGFYKFGPVNATVMEGFVIGSVFCTDADIGINAAISYSVADNDFFSISSAGLVTVSGDLRNRQLDNIAVTGTCADSGTPRLQTNFTVVVEVFEFNLYPPVFQQPAYSVVLSENFTTFTPFLNVSATDNDTGLNGRLEYRLVNNFENQFFISAGSGSLQLLLQLDFEKQDMYQLVVEAVDAASDSKVRFTASTSVAVEVTGVNEHTPICSQPVYTATISASTTGQVLAINCTDLDDGADGELSYSITAGNNDQLFNISSDGAISIPSAIEPNEDIEVYEITVIVSDQGSPSLQTEVTVSFVYSFNNLQHPSFTQPQYSALVSESTPVGVVVLTITAEDNDPGPQGQVTYSLSGTSFFRINSETGAIFVSENLDAEAMLQLTFTVTATDNDPVTPFSNTTNVTITLSDVNDNVPYCTSQLYIASIGSSLNIGSPILTLQDLCKDDDIMFSQLSYKLLQNDSFSISSSTGELTVAGMLTPGTTTALSVVVKDNGSPPLSTTITVSVQVLFDNTAPPAFSQNQYSFNISEGTALLSTVGLLSATDTDSPASDLTFSLVSSTFGSIFYIDPSSGEIILTGPLDFETETQYIFTVQVEDAGGFNNTNPLSDTASVIVNVLNTNDFPPVLNNGGVYGSVVNKTTSNGTVVVNIRCTDGDLPPFGNPTIVEHDFTGSIPFSLQGGGEDWTVTVSGSLLSSSGSSSYIRNFTCADQGGQSANGQVFLFVPDITAPAFTKAMYEWTLPENARVGVEFTDIQANSQSGGELTYDILNGNEGGFFYINPDSGTVSLAGTLDYEAQRQHALVIRAVDEMNRQSSVLLLVQVLDINDEIPLVSPSATFQLDQFREAGYPVGQLQCSDNDTLLNATQFNFSFATPIELFSIDSNGVIRLQGSLDATPVYVLPTNCFDVSRPDIVSIGVVTIQVVFTNLHSPQFQFTSYEVSISEGASLQTVVITVEATDNDVGSFGEISYSITAGNPNKFFIDPLLGHISVLTALDREEQSTYTLTVEAVDGGTAADDSTRMSGTVNVTVNILDINDNKPMLGRLSYIQTILTNHTLLTPVLQVGCSDPDLLENGTVGYVSPPHSDFIISENGTILLSSPQPDQTVHNFYVTCRDMGVESLSSSSLVTVVVNKLNFAAPVFENPAYNISIPENLPLLSSILQVRANTTDASVGIVYSISSGNERSKFSMNTLTGEILLVDSLNLNQQSQYTLTVEAATTGFVSYSAQATVSITLVDVNNNNPVFTSPFYAGSVTEAMTAMTPAVQVNCSDLDPTSTLTYSITGGLGDGYTNAFTVSSEGLIIPQQELDYEDKTVFTLTVQCSDGGSNAAEATVRIDVLPVNEFKPVFTQSSYQFTVEENTALSTLLGMVNATDADAGSHGEITYLLQDPGSLSPVFIEPSSGNIIVSSLLDYEQMDFFNLSVIARDQGGLESYVPVEITLLNLNDVPPVLTPSIYVYPARVLTTTPQDFFIQAYTCVDGDGSATSIIISGGNDLGLFSLNTNNQIVWAATSPTGISTDMVISLTLLCTDAGNQTDTATIAISVGPPNKPVPMFSQTQYSASIEEDAANGTFVLQVSATSSNMEDIEYSIPELFPEFPFDIDAMSGNITLQGTLSRESNSFYSFPVQATDTVELTSTLSTVNIAVIDVNDNYPMILPSSLSISLLEDASTGMVYAKYTCTDLDEGENGLTSFSILSGSPPNLFSIGTGAASGNVFLQQQLDFESTTAYNITIACSDAGTPALTSSATLLVAVSGINEYPPAFEQGSYDFSIPETTAPGTIFGRVNATDSDDGVNGVFHYEALGGAGAEFFSVDSSTGEVMVKRSLNASENSQLGFLVAAIDRGPPAPFTSTVLISVSVGDENSPPFFSQIGYIAIVPTSQAVGESILNIACFDTDLGQNARVRMITVSNDLEESVYLQSSEVGGQGSVMGSLILNGSLDAGSYELIILCMDSGSPPMGRNTSVTVIVQGSNMAPVFNQSYYGLALNENTPPATSLLTVLATDDSDAGVTYSITGGTGAGTFVVDENTGVVALNLALNYEVTNSYLFTVAATDQDATNPLTGYAQVAVTVNNVNDNPPNINPKSTIITISENEQSGRVVQSYTCADADGGSVTISISPSSAPFAIDSDGDVTTTSMLDYEVATSYPIIVTCRDSGISAGDSVMSSTATLNVAVEPFNFDAPQFTSLSSFNVSENATIGSTVSTITSFDPDNRGTISYSTSSHTNVFTINPTTGVISLLAGLDREVTNVYILQITASDNDNEQGKVTPKVNTTTIQIYVTDINDNSPTCDSTLVTVNIFDGQYNDSHSLFNASCSDVDLGLNGQVRYQIVDNSVPSEGNFTLDSITGELTFTGTITTASSTAILQIKVHDLGTDPVTSPITIQVILTVRSFDAPFFDPDEFNVTIPENLAPLSLVFNGSQLVSALHNTKGGTVTFSLSIASGNFVVDASTGNVVLSSTLDYDSLPQMYGLVIRAEIGSVNVETILTIQLTDYNDNAPVFSFQIFNATVLENQPNGTFVTQVSSSDADSGINAMVIYFISGSGSTNFQIDRTTGRITTLISFDRETIDQYSFIVMAMDLGSPSLNSTAIVSVTIGDVNDLPPQFSLDVYPVNINNIEEPETVLITFTVMDPDSTGSLRFNLDTSNSFIESILRVDPDSGALVLKAPIPDDYNPQSSFTVIVDDGMHVDTTTVILTIFEVTSTAFSLLENTLRSYDVFEFLQQHSFAITSEAIYSIKAGDPYGQFNVTSDGMLENIVTLDRENTSIYTLQIAVTDNSTSINVNLMVEIIVGDVNDNSPIFSQSKYQFRILEQNYAVRTVIGQVNATDRDDPNTSNGRIGYSFFATLSPQLQRLRPEINSVTGEISLLGQVDRETDALYSFRVRARDFGGPTSLSNLAEVDIIVEDVNDRFPDFEPQDVAGYRIFFTNEARAGSVAERVLADFQFGRSSEQDGIRFSDVDVNDSVTASIDTTNFALTNTTSPVYIVTRNDITLRISGTTFTITITDAAGHQAQKNITVIVTEVPTATPTVQPSVILPPTRPTLPFPQTTLGMIVLAVGSILLMAFIFFFCCVICYSYQFYRRRKERKEKEKTRPYMAYKRVDEDTRHRGRNRGRGHYQQGYYNEMDRRGGSYYNEGYRNHDIDQLECPDVAPRDPEEGFVYGEFNVYDSQFQPPYMAPQMGYPPYPYGEVMETPLTSTSRLPSDELDDSGHSSYQMGPILQQMLEEFQLGDELLKKEKKSWSIRLGRSKS